MPDLFFLITLERDSITWLTRHVAIILDANTENTLQTCKTLHSDKRPFGPCDLDLAYHFPSVKSVTCNCTYLTETWY